MVVVVMESVPGADRSARGQPACGGGCDRVAEFGKDRDCGAVTRSLPLPVLTTFAKVSTLTLLVKVRHVPAEKSCPRANSNRLPIFGPTTSANIASLRLA